MSMPVKFRKEIGKKVVITPGLDQCLFVFATAEWAKVSKKLSDTDKSLSFLSADRRNFNRLMFGRATEVEVDRIGRILIPEFLKERIGLKNSAAVIGVEDRVEIWNDKTWREYEKGIERDADKLAERIGDA
jgi:MraZ protein